MCPRSLTLVLFIIVYQRSALKAPVLFNATRAISAQVTNGSSSWIVNNLDSTARRSFFSSSKTSEAAPSISEGEVKSLFSLWNDALATLDPDTVAKRYASKSVLLPTVSDIPRTDYNSIKSYFVDFLKKKPQGVILESNVIQGPDWCMDAGIYEFTMGATGDKVKARYTYVYTFEDGEWKITHHHSSVMPENP